MRADILERVERRLDKKCGASGIPEKAKCSKKPVTEEASEQEKTKVASKASREKLLKNLAVYGGVYLALSYGPLLALNAKELMGGASLDKKAPDFVADERFDPSKLEREAEKIGEGLFGEAFLDKKEGIIYKKSRDTGEVVEKAKAQGENLGNLPGQAWLLGNISVQHTKQNEAAAQYVAGQLGVAPKLLGKKGNVMGMEYLEGYSPQIKGDLEVQDQIKKKTVEALAALHIAGISHNDLHANNVMFKTGKDGSVADIKIIDYGLAKFDDYNGIAREALNSAGKASMSVPEFIKNKKALLSEIKTAKTNEQKQKAIADFYIKAGVIRATKKDSAQTRIDVQNNCERGERCGDTCIDPNEECNIRDVSPEVGKAIDDLSDVLLNAIPGYGSIVAAKKLLVVGQAALKAVKNPNTPLSKKVIMGAAILAGISFLGYKKYRDYRQGKLGESATIAKTTSRGMAIKETAKDQLTFTVDGGGRKQTLQKAMVESGGFDSHEIIDFSESLDDPIQYPADMSDRDKQIAREAERAKGYFGNLASGRSNHAVDLAAQILAYREKHPQKRINIVAHGGGAQTALEAADILGKADRDIGSKLKVVNLQGVDYGIYDGGSGVVSIGSDRNPASLLPMKNKSTFGVDDAGDGTGFFKNRRSLAYIKGHLSGGTGDVRTTYQQPTSYGQQPNAYRQQPPEARQPLPANVQRSAFNAVENRPATQTSLLSDPAPSATAAIKKAANPFDKQEFETKKYNYENNIKSAEGSLKRLYQRLETAPSESIAEIEEAIAHTNRSLNGHKDRLKWHLENHAGRNDSVAIAVAALAGAVAGAGIHHFATRGGKTARKKPHCVNSKPCGEGCAPKGSKCQDESPSGVQDVDPKTLKTDPNRFQYKIVHNEAGASGSLTDVKKWNPDIGGVLQVWKDPADGHTYVVNGHNRHDLAMRAGAENVSVRHLQVQNAAEARAVGALTNIAEGRGNSIDAAKFFRDTKKTRQELEAVGVPLREKNATEGLAIANLSGGLFDRVIQGTLPVERAAVIGAAGISHEEQGKLMSLVDKRTIGGKPLNNDTIKELADMVRDAPRAQSNQMSLFGADDASESLAIQKAELISDVRRQLRSEKKLFGTVSKKRAASSLSKGGNVIDIEQSKQISEGAAHVLGIFDALKGKRGPLSERINDAVVRISNGEKSAAVRGELYQWVARELPATLKRSAA
jgi:predicted Ser/Thr protein kinase